MSTFKPTGRKTMTAEITLLQVCIRLKRGTQHTTNLLDKRGGNLDVWVVGRDWGQKWRPTSRQNGLWKVWKIWVRSWRWYVAMLKNDAPRLDSYILYCSVLVGHLNILPGRGIISRAGSEHFLKPQGPRKIVLGGKFGWAVWDFFGGI